MENEDIKTIIWALEHYDEVVDTINKLLNSYKKLQQENQQYKNAWNELKEGIEINMDYYESSKFKEFVSLNDIEELEQKYNIGG